MKKSPEKGASPYKQLQITTYQRSQANTGTSSPKVVSLGKLQTRNPTSAKQEEGSTLSRNTL